MTPSRKSAPRAADPPSPARLDPLQFWRNAITRIEVCPATFSLDLLLWAARDALRRVGSILAGALDAERAPRTWVSRMTDARRALSRVQFDGLVVSRFVLDVQRTVFGRSRKCRGFRFRWPRFPWSFCHARPSGPRAGSTRHSHGGAA